MVIVCISIDVVVMLIFCIMCLVINYVMVGVKMVIIDLMRNIRNLIIKV